MDNKDLQRFINENNVNAELLELKGNCHSVKQAAEVIGVREEDFIKSIIFVAPDKKAVVAIVNGLDRASSKRVSKALGIEFCRVATPEQALKYTGYAVGGTPPISIPNVKVLMDEKVKKMKFLYGGGGSEFHLLKTNPDEIIRVTNAKVVRVRK